MAGQSELEDFLHQQLQEGRLESTGHFTLSREKALEKLAAFQLPRETAWILKIVQGAVLSRASFLQVKQTSTDTVFTFDPQEAWTPAEIETAMLDPEVSPSAALDHLKRGLWSVSLNGMRPFHCSPHLSEESLVWDGKEFHCPPCKVTQHFVLTVSHRTIFQGKGLPILRSIEAAQTNSALAKELSEGAFVCPIPLQLDGRRLDAFQGCPTHGLQLGTYPVCLLMAALEGPALPVPPGTYGKYTPAKPGDSSLSQSLRHLEKPSQEAGAALMVSTHLRQVSENKNTVWRKQEHDSFFYWVRHGVVVQRQEVSFLNAAPVSCAVFASAEGLRSDLSGFSIAGDPATKERQLQVYAVLASRVERAELSLTALIDNARMGAKVLGTALVVGGGFLAFFSPLHGLGAIGFGAYSIATAGSTEKALEEELRRDLETLKQGWKYYPRL